MPVEISHVFLNSGIRKYIVNKYTHILKFTYNAASTKRVARGLLISLYGKKCQLLTFSLINQPVIR